MNSQDPVYWQTYAEKRVRASQEQGDWATNREAITAATALISDWEGHHPSWVNTQFAIAAFFFHWHSNKLRRLAYCMVANGLGGYWQWESHNPARFSVVDALRHLGIITAEEAGDVDQFTVREMDTGCRYLIVNPELLNRLVKCFDLPVGTLETTGKICLPDDSRLAERQRIKERCVYVVGGVDRSLRQEYQEAFRLM